MINCVVAEYRKFKRTFIKKLSWAAPVFIMLLCIILGVGDAFQRGSYNWWYTILLPITIALICGGVINKDRRKLKYHAIFSLPVSLDKLWVYKIIVCIWFYLISCIVMFIGTTIGGFIFGKTISIGGNIEGSILLFITILWQIPLCLFFTDRIGVGSAIFINWGCTIVGTILADSSSWVKFPHAIPVRLMCSVMGILPNGLPVPKSSPLMDKSVIMPGVLISIILFFILTVITAILFRKREVR